jgi:predicted transcriptional regulator
MKTITLKADDTFFEKVTDMAKQMHLTKSELIRRAIGEYEETIRRRALKEQMLNAALRVKEHSKKINEEFSDTLMDGLDDV